MTLPEFIEACREEGRKQWCYPALVDDHMERAVQAFDLNESPADFIEWLGKKYDLTSWSVR